MINNNDNSNQSDFQINNVEWDQESQSYKVVTNPNWNIALQTEVYADLINQGFGDEASSSIVGMFNSTRPVYRCSCHSDHTVPGHSFNPCPCFECEMHARRDGVDITKPTASVSLHKNTVHVIGDMIRRNYLSSINELLEGKLVITEKHFADFQFLLRQYGETQNSWTEVADSFDTEDDEFWLALFVLEQFWIDFMLNNPAIQPPSR